MRGRFLTKVKSDVDPVGLNRAGVEAVGARGSSSPSEVLFRSGTIGWASRRSSTRRHNRCCSLYGIILAAGFVVDPSSVPADRCPVCDSDTCDFAENLRALRSTLDSA